MPVPAALQPNQFIDLGLTTLADLGEPSFTDLYSTQQVYTAYPRLLKKERVEIDSGKSIQFNVMVNTGQPSQASNASATGIDQDALNIADTQAQGSADWRRSTTSYMLLAPVVAMNRSGRRIVDYVKTQRLKALIDLADLMETNIWGPPVALADTLTPWGFNTWLVKNATEGFTGTVPTGYTTIGGLNPTTYPAWCNWAGPYTVVSRDDLFRKVRKACRFTNFKPPVSVPQPGSTPNYEYFTNNAVLQAIEEQLEASNDNLKNEMAPYDNSAVLNRQNITWVPKLEADTTNPFYGINFGMYVKTYILAGFWMQELNVGIVPGQHLASGHFIDCIYQPVFKNRRGSFVISNGTTYPS